MTDVKRQHYVPRFLLKHFCVKGSYIIVTDLMENRTYRTNVINVAQENHFYDLKTMSGEVSLEEMFSGLESKTAPIVDKIVEMESIGWMTDFEYRILEDFILCQIYRTRKYVNRVKSILQTSDVPLFDHFRKNGDFVETVSSKKIPIDDNIAKTISYNILNHIEHDTVVRDSIASMKWLLLKAEDRERFIISDDPIVLNNRYAKEEFTDSSHGFDLPHTQIFFPISPKLLLNLSACQLVEESKNCLLKALMKGVIIDMSDAYKCSVTGEACGCPSKIVKLFNTLQKNNAERCVFG